MYKNQLQELAQRSCFNLPSYACIREGPDHAPRFKASVNFNGEIFEGPSYCTTLRQAEHAAAEVALNSLSTKGPSRSIAARVLDETGVHKNLLQETAHRAGLNLPVYTTVRSGPGHQPVFTSTVELAEMKFNGAPAKTKKQAEKNAAMAAWAALKQMATMGSLYKTNKEIESNEEQEQVVVARVLSNLRPKDENKAVRPRDLNQARRRTTLGYREKKCASLQFQQRSSVGSDHSSVYPTQQQINPFSYSSNRSIPVQVRSRFQMQETPPPLEEHQKDEAEWLNGKSSDIITETSIENMAGANTANSSNSVFGQKPAYHTPFTYHSKPTQINARPYGVVSHPRILNTGGVQAHSIAPAVHIRSVIPVCAAPPMRLPSSNSPKTTPQMKKEEEPITVSASVYLEKEQEVPEYSSKLKDLHL